MNETGETWGGLWLSKICSEQTVFFVLKVKVNKYWYTLKIQI